MSQVINMEGESLFAQVVRNNQYKQIDVMFSFIFNHVEVYPFNEADLLSWLDNSHPFLKNILD